MEATFVELRDFYLEFHRLLACAFNDLERRAADFYCFDGEQFHRRDIAPDGAQQSGFWNREARRLMQSRNRYRDEQQAWAAANAAYQRMLENLRWRYEKWYQHRALGRPDRTCLALKDVTLDKLRRLAAKGITTSVEFELAGQDGIRAIRGIGTKIAAKLRSRIRPPRRLDNQPLLF